MIRLNVNKLLDFEKRNLLEKITRYIGQKLSRTNNLKDIEIQKYLGIPNTRLSEWKDFDKYKIRITEKHLALCLGGGIVSVEELINNCTDNEKEAEYLKTLELWEDVPLQEMIKRCKAVGLNPLEILKESYKEQLKKIK